ncbi:M48 family metalloprotease [bacterium]|nr:M48 family metalloprotease [bacterium]
MPKGSALLVLCVVCVCLTLSGCKDGGTWLFSRDDEVKLGTDAAAEFEKTNKISADAALARFVAGVGASVAAAATPPDYPYKFKVIDTTDVNAVAFPGGPVYVYRGLLEKTSMDRDMIAWVLGHEVSHIALQHAAKRIENQVGVELITQTLLGKGSAAQVAGLISGLMFQDYGRDKELQADHQGLLYAAKAGYDPTAAIGVIQVFQSLSGGKDPNKLELLFMSHPGDNTRINQIKSLCAKYGYRGKYYKP